MKNKRYMKNSYGVLAALCGLVAIAAQFLFGAGSSILAANTYDAAIDIPKNLVRTNDVAVSARHLLWAEGTTPGTTAALATASTLALGTIDNIETGTGVAQEIKPLKSGYFTKLVANAAMATIGVNVYQAASGKIGLTGVILVGKLRSAAGADGDVVLVEACNPVVNPGGSTTKGSGVLAVPVTHRSVVMTTGGAEALTLADGLPGQRLHLVLGTDGGDGTLTPTTKTGFATIVFADAKDNVDLEFINSTVGWVILGSAGVAAPPVIS
jgi:hypothetical protein